MLDKNIDLMVTVEGKQGDQIEATTRIYPPVDHERQSNPIGNKKLQVPGHRKDKMWLHQRFRSSGRIITVCLSEYFSDIRLINQKKRKKDWH